MNHCDPCESMAGCRKRGGCAPTEVDGPKQLDAAPVEPAAWLVPRLISFKGAKFTSCPAEHQPSVDGTVAWSAQIFCDSQAIPVTDKYGVSHYPKPLIVAALASVQETKPGTPAALADADAWWDSLPRPRMTLHAAIEAIRDGRARRASSNDRSAPGTRAPTLDERLAMIRRHIYKTAPQEK